MARQEAEREDLMAEATALRERVEFAVAGLAEPVVAGFRTGGQWSLYFGSDPVYHFSDDGALRRAFLGGDLYRSQGQTLAQLVRTRTGDQVLLVRHDLTAGELARFMDRMSADLASLKIAIETGAVRVARQVPNDANLETKLLAALGDAAKLRLAKAVKRGG